jgi:hypothetical protein
MIDIREFRDCRCRYCNSKIEHPTDPDDKNKIQTFKSNYAKICKCGRSGWEKYAYSGNVFNFYFNEQFTIQCVIKHGIIKSCILLKNKYGYCCTDDSFVGTDSLYQMKDLSSKVNSTEQLFLIVDCFIGTLGFQ